jgi:hypothetical protein
VVFLMAAWALDALSRGTFSSRLGFCPRDGGRLE